MKLLREYIRELLTEGRYEAETTQISRAIVNWVKDKLSEGLPQDEVPKYKRDHPFHNLGIRMFDVPSTLRDQLNRLTATIKVDPDPNAMQDTFEVAGKAGTSTSGSKDLQVQIYLRSDFTLRDMNDFIADLKETIIHELEHTGQSEEILDTAEPHNDRLPGQYDWNKLDGLRNYYSSQSEMEAYAKGAFKKAKVKGITYPEAIDEMLNSSMRTFLRRYGAYADAGATDRLDYNEQDLKNYFQKELRDQILDIARLKYPKAHGLNESNVLAVGMCFPFATKKAEEWFDDHFVARKGRAPKRHPDLNDMSKFKVVHGKVTDQWKKPPKPIVHAWIEIGDLVFDDQTKMTKPNGVPKDVYYDMYQPEVVKEYSAEEVVVNCIMKGEGPWDEALVDTMKQRDAWMKESTLRKYIGKLLTESVHPKIMSMIDELEKNGGHAEVLPDRVILYQPTENNPQRWVAMVAYETPAGARAGGKCGRAGGVVQGSTAKTGMGPLAYDVAIEAQEGMGLISDRASISADALAVWDYYMNNRPDVEVVQLDDQYNTLTPEDEDNCDQTMADSYGLGDWESSSLSKLYKKSGTPVMDELRKRGMLK